MEAKIDLVYPERGCKIGYIVDTSSDGEGTWTYSADKDTGEGETRYCTSTYITAEAAPTFRECSSKIAALTEYVRYIAKVEIADTTPSYLAPVA